MADNGNKSGIVIVNEDGTETPLETVPSHQVTPPDAPEGSGLYDILKDYTEESEDKKKDEGGEEEQVEGKKKEEQAEDIKNLLDNDDEEDPNKEKDNPPAEEGDDKYGKLDEEQLRTEVTKLDSDLTTITTENENLKNDLSTAREKLTALERDGVGDPEAVEFIKGLKTDFAGTLEKFRTKYDIPDNNTLLTQMGGSANASRNARLKQYIKGELQPKIEKDYDLEAGTFEFDEKAAWDDPESASYAFRKGLDEKEAEYATADSRLKESEAEMLKVMQARQADDIKYIAEKYYDKDDAKVAAIMEEMNAIPTKIAAGELKPEDHPLSLRYVIKGFKYDELVQAEVETAVNDLKEQLKNLGVTLPDGKELPTDLSKTKENKKPVDNKPIKIEGSKYSPMALNIENTIN